MKVSVFTIPFRNFKSTKLKHIYDRTLESELQHRKLRSRFLSNKFLVLFVRTKQIIRFEELLGSIESHDPADMDNLTWCQLKWEIKIRPAAPY